jgi:hypothetical protein
MTGRDVCANAFCDAEGVGGLGVREKQGELLAAEPAGQVVLAQLGVEGASDFLDDLATQALYCLDADHPVYWAV